jgi:CheY-like chemotaxis protein
MENKSTARILVVDDDPDILEALTLILESRGYQITGARNGLEALDRIEKERPDLMILDLLMPKMDGFAVYKRLHGSKLLKDRNMPILILSSVREEASRRRYELETGKKLAVNEYMEKPFMPEELLKKIEKLIENAPISGS